MPARSRRARHRARSAGATLRSLGLTAGAIGAATALAVGLSGGSYALWSNGSSASAGAIAAGSASLSITSSVTPSLWSNLTPGESVRQPFTVTNTGTVPMTLSGSASIVSSAIEVRLASGACPGTALTATQASVSPTSLGTVAAGASVTVCLEARLATSAAPGASSAFTVTITGTQV
jgi:hypothetical protein